MSLARAASRVVWRLRADYASASRTEEYASMLRHARGAGYTLIPLAEFVANVRGRKPLGRCLILRHDVDINDAAGNAAFFQAELESEARASYYFRLSTARSHATLIRRLLGAGFEVGYHFEEGATLAKRYRLRSREEVFRHREKIVVEFRKNCDSIRGTWNPALRSACAHGDWINRKLGFINNELIDPRLLSECGLDFEAYDPEIRTAVDAYLSDVATPPQKWAGGVTPLDAMREGLHRIYILTHERRWHSGRLAKASADTSRLWDAVRFASPW